MVHGHGMLDASPDALKVGVQAGAKDTALVAGFKLDAVLFEGGDKTSDMSKNR